MSTWSSNFNHNFGFVVEEIFELGHIRKSRCFDTKKIVLRLCCQLSDKFRQKLKLESCESIQCEAILKDVVLLPGTNSLSFSILYLKKPRLKGTVAQELTGSQKFTSNQYIQQQLKRSLKPPESISAFRSIVGNTKRDFKVLTFWFCTNLVQPEIFHTNSHFNQFPGVVVTYKSKYVLCNKSIIPNSI